MENAHVAIWEDFILLRKQYSPNWSTVNKIPIRNPYELLVEIDKLVSKLHMELQGTQNSPKRNEYEEHIWRIHSCWFQNFLESKSNQDKMVRSLSWTHRSTEWNWEHTKKTIRARSTDSRKTTFKGEIRVFSTNAAGSDMQKNEIGPLHREQKWTNISEHRN